MAKQKTKEELVKENNALTAEIQNLNKLVDFIKDENKKKAEDIRKEFAKAFGWYEMEESFGYSSKTKKLREPSWGEILVELGKLLNVGTVRDFEGNLSEVEVKVENLAKAVVLLSMGKTTNLRGNETGQIVGTLGEHACNGDILAVDFKTGYLRKALPTDNQPK